MALSNIILIGFMGVGKTTVAESLSRLYGMDMIEMDQVIAKIEEMTISDIFMTHGEAYFRHLETKLLISLFTCNNTVVSCGGGAALLDENIKIMKQNGHVVLLTASPETILERVKASDERPLLNGNKSIEFISDLMKKRWDKYQSASDIIIQTDNKSIQNVCEELMTKLGELEG